MAQLAWVALCELYSSVKVSTTTLLAVGGAARPTRNALPVRLCHLRGLRRRLRAAPSCRRLATTATATAGARHAAFTAAPSCCFPHATITLAAATATLTLAVAATTLALAAAALAAAATAAAHLHPLPHPPTDSPIDDAELRGWRLRQPILRALQLQQCAGVCSEGGTPATAYMWRSAKTSSYTSIFYLSATS